MSHQDAIDMDVVDRKKAKKPKIEVIAEEVETPAVVSKDNKKAKGFEIKGTFRIIRKRRER